MHHTHIIFPFPNANQIYNASNLRLALVGPQFKHTINALACKRDFTFAAIGRSIIQCTRVHRTAEYTGPHTADIIQLLVLGDLLFSLARDGTLAVWTIGTPTAPLRTITLPSGFTPTCMAHPDTYINKIIIGSTDGRMQLWNFSSGKCIHQFDDLCSRRQQGTGDNDDDHDDDNDDGNTNNTSIRCIVPSPALDVVGVGLSDGYVLFLFLLFVHLSVPLLIPQSSKRFECVIEFHAGHKRTQEIR